MTIMRRKRSSTLKAPQASGSCWRWQSCTLPVLSFFSSACEAESINSGSSKQRAIRRSPILPGVWSQRRQRLKLLAARLELPRKSLLPEARLAASQKEQITAVSGEVAGVKTDVGGVKTDVASTKADLEATKAKLASAVGDLGMQSGLIAKTRDDLEILKHQGDRNYYEFTLVKGAKPLPSSD